MTGLCVRGQAEARGDDQGLPRERWAMDGSLSLQQAGLPSELPVRAPVPQPKLSVRSRR